MAFLQWVDYAATAVHQRVVVQRALARLSQREVAGAFGRWQEQVLAARDTARAVAKAQKFFLALKNHAAHTAFSGWCEAAHTLAAQRRLVRKSLMRMQQRALSQALWDWADGVDAQKAAAADRERAERAVRLMANRSQHSAFARWVEFVEQCDAQRSLLERVAARMRNVKLAASFAGWADAAADLRDRRQKLRRAAGRLAGRAQSMAFLQWVDYAATAVHQRVVVQRALARLGQREVAGAFGRWQEQVLAARDTARAVAKAQKFFLALKNHAAHTAFSGWCEAAHTLAAQRRLVRKSLMRMQQRALSQALWDWADGVDAQKAEAADRKRAERALKLMTNRSLHVAFGRWVEYAEQCAAQRALLGRVAARMLNVKLAAALAGWEEATACLLYTSDAADE